MNKLNKDDMFITAELRPKRQEILDKSHENISSVLCRRYAGDDYDWSALPLKAFELLAKLTQKEIDILAADKSYDMIPRLRIKDKIRINKKDGVTIRVSGSYFKDREAFSFNFKDSFIGFCGEMSGCNRTPFITGFVNWVDELNK
jgi:hypothetical protein